MVEKVNINPIFAPYIQLRYGVGVNIVRFHDIDEISECAGQPRVRFPVPEILLFGFRDPDQIGSKRYLLRSSRSALNVLQLGSFLVAERESAYTAARAETAFHINDDIFNQAEPRDTSQYPRPLFC